jgi:hypothetical protein
MPTAAYREHDPELRFELVVRGQVSAREMPTSTRIPGYPRRGKAVAQTGTDGHDQSGAKELEPARRHPEMGCQRAGPFDGIRPSGRCEGYKYTAPSTGRWCNTCS